MENYTVLVPPYTVGPEAYRSIPEYCRVYGTTAVVIGGKKAMAAAHDKLLAAVDGSEIAISGFFHFGTECTFSAAHALEAEPAIQNADMIFAVGGGKAVDTAKLVALDLNKPFLTFPTIASNCAASSALAIVYNEDGSFCDFVHFLQSAKHVFLDTDIMAQAPIRFLWAGIGDTYAKFYEVSISARGERLEQFRAAGVTLCRMCLYTMREHGAQALEANRSGQSTYDLEQVVLTIVITTGWVSMLVARDHTMDYNGGVAHAFYYGLCSLPGFADDEKRLHGVVVALGVLMLLLVDGREGECRQLQDFNRTVNLPTCLQDVDITVDDVRRAAPEILRDADLEHYPYQVTEDMLVRAAEKLAS